MSVAHQIQTRQTEELRQLQARHNEERDQLLAWAALESLNFHLAPPKGAVFIWFTYVPKERPTEEVRFPLWVLPSGVWRHTVSAGVSKNKEWASMIEAHARHTPVRMEVYSDTGLEVYDFA